MDDYDYYASIYDVKQQFHYPGLPAVRMVYNKDGMIRFYTQFDKSDCVRPHKITFFFYKSFHKRTVEKSMTKNKPFRCFYKQRDGRIRDCGLWIPRRIWDNCVELKIYSGNN